MTNYYSKNAQALSEQYNSLPFDQVHSEWLPHLPEKPGLALDVGAGSGRDARALSTCACPQVPPQMPASSSQSNFNSTRQFRPAQTPYESIHTCHRMRPRPSLICKVGAAEYGTYIFQRVLLNNNKQRAASSVDLQKYRRFIF